AMLRTLPAVYEYLRDHFVPGETVVGAQVTALGARLAQEKLGVPMATIHLQPTVLRSAIATPKLPRFPTGPWVPPALKRLLFWVADVGMVDPLITPALNEYRSTLGLPPVRRIMNGWWHSPQLVLGLFPDWFAPPQADWPPNVRLTGFPLFD